MDRVLLRIPEAAMLLGVGRSKAYELVASGVWPSIRIGERSVRVPLAELMKWVNCRVEGGDESTLDQAFQGNACRVGQ